MPSQWIRCELAKTTRIERTIWNDRVLPWPWIKREWLLHLFTISYEAAASLCGGVGLCVASPLSLLTHFFFLFRFFPCSSNIMRDYYYCSPSPVQEYSGAATDHHHHYSHQRRRILYGLPLPEIAYPLTQPSSSSLSSSSFPRSFVWTTQTTCVSEWLVYFLLLLSSILSSPFHIAQTIVHPDSGFFAAK